MTVERITRARKRVEALRRHAYAVDVDLHNLEGLMAVAEGLDDEDKPVRLHSGHYNETRVGLSLRWRIQQAVLDEVEALHERIARKV